MLLLQVTMVLPRLHAYITLQFTSLKITKSARTVNTMKRTFNGHATCERKRERITSGGTLLTLAYSADLGPTLANRRSLDAQN
jgi:hypothetical protein